MDTGAKWAFEVKCSICNWSSIMNTRRIIRLFPDLVVIYDQALEVDVRKVLNLWDQYHWHCSLESLQPFCIKSQYLKRWLDTDNDFFHTLPWNNYNLCNFSAVLCSTRSPITVANRKRNSVWHISVTQRNTFSKYAWRNTITPAENLF